MKNITYINAGAGSGKTYRLTEEMVNLVKSGQCTPSQIIASTFTIAAAADLKKKAREMFLQNGLIPQAAELDSAAIGTVHSIGLKYIRKYWYKLGLSASVETITEDAKKGYLNRTMTKVVTDADIAAFRDYAETFGLKMPQSTKFNYDFWKSLVQKLVETADAFGIDDLRVSEANSFKLAKLLLGANGSFAFMNGTNKSENELRNMYYDCIQRIFSIAKQWYVLFNQYKEGHGLIEFNDMESKFITLLEDAEVRAEISRTIKYVFVDEFQDSNPKQIKIFDLLSDLVERSYWVGDPKQAIYGFRGCDTELVQALTDKIINEKGNNGMDYDTLKESRRSVKPLVDTTSAVFTKVFDDMDPEMVTLTAHRTQSLPNNTPALWHWEQQKTLEAGMKRATASKAKLFKSIACQVRDLVDGKGDIKYVIDKESGNTRKVISSDIAILARSNSDVYDITEALKAKDISVVCDESVNKRSKEFQLIRLLMNYMIDESPLLKAEIAHLLFGMKTEDVLNGKELPDFGKLDDLKDKLKTLSVADMVKSLIIELDILHRCQKWGKADQRQRNLQAIIEDAIVFDTNAETLGEASTIEHYLDHLDNEDEDVIVNEGFFQEGVHVMTYHGSKGLQWNVVILCSLDDDPLKEKTLKKRFAVGVNYVRMSQPNAGQLYSDYYLTCLPAFISAANASWPDEMMNAIETLDSYHQYVERIRYESRRLLYVGVTRARDYLITTSMEKTNMSWLTTSGIQPQINDTGVYQAIWGEGKNISESKFVKVIDNGTYQSRPEPEKYFCRKEKALTTEPEGKYLTPSKLADDVLKDNVQYSVIYPVKDDKPHPIIVGKGDEFDIMGTCVHNIFAIYRPEIDRMEMRNKARKIVDAHKMNKMLPDVDSILESIDSLYKFLEKNYGKAVKIGHEVPFRHERNGQVVSGEMDLLWYTAPTECVLIDFKNYPGAMVKVLNKDSKEYVGKYAAQLQAYEEALTVAGMSLKAKLVYYSVLGCLVELK